MTDLRQPPGSEEDLDFAALDASEGMAVEPVTQWKLFRSRLGRHRLALASAAVLALILIFVFLADIIPGIGDPIQELKDDDGRALNLLAPRADHWFGTDILGRDVLARTVYGGRTSLTVAGVTGLMVMVLGTTVGSIAGYYGGWIDNALMRFTDLVLILPLLPVAIVAAAFLSVA